MSFCKAKIHRFNDVKECLPSPATYKIKTNEKPKVADLIQSEIQEKSSVSDFSSSKSVPFFRTPTLLKRKKKPFENISKPKAQQKLFNITSTQQEVLRDKIVECENKDACIKDLTQQLEEIKDEMSQLRSQRGHLQLEKTKYEQTIKNTNTKHKNDLESVNHVFKGIMREVNEKKQGLTQQLLFLRNEYENFMKENLKQMMELKDNCDKFPLLLKESSEEYIRLIGIKEAQLENKEKELKAFEGSCIEMQNQHYLEIEKMKKEHHLEVQDIEFELLKNMSELQREKELSLNKIRTMEDKLQEQIFEIKKIFENERKQLILESKRELKEVKQHFKDSNLITEIELKEKLNEVETDWRNKLTIQEKEAEAILKECQAISEYSIIQCEIEKNKIKTDLQQTTDHLNNIESKYANVMKLYEDILIKYEDSQAKLNKFVNKLNQIENHFHGVLQEKNVEIDQLAKEKSTYQITMKNSQATVEVLKKRLINSDRDVEQLKKEITDCEGKILEYEQKCLQLTSELKQAQTFNDELEMQYESSIKLNRTDIDNMGLKLLEKVDDYQREVETYSKKIEYERKLKKEIMQQLHDAYDMINRLKLDLENIEMLHSQYKFELEQSQNELEDYHMREMDWNIIRDKLEHTIEELEEILEAKHLEIDELKKKIVHLEEKNNSYSQYSDYYQKKLQEYEDEQIETGNIHKKYIEISGKYDQLSQKLEEMEIKQLQHQCEVENLEKEAAEAGHWKEQYHKQKKDYDELSEKNDTLRKQMRNNKKHDDEPTTKLQLEKLMANRDFLLSKVEYLENKLKEECQKNADLAEHQNNNHLVGLRVKNEELVQSNIDLETKLQTAQRTIEKLKKENDLKKVMKKNKVSKEDKENFGSPNRSLNSSRIESPFRNRN
ncbi:hypothetical protein JTB14_035042 [Gonioctena quinquepunctata]|nr:hypothetical protein JTB14_035042 [Gonioctena quinquepunctata]